MFLFSCFFILFFDLSLFHVRNLLVVSLLLWRRKIIKNKAPLVKYVHFFSSFLTRSLHNLGIRRYFFKPKLHCRRNKWSEISAVFQHQHVFPIKFPTIRIRLVRMPETRYFTGNNTTGNRGRSASSGTEIHNHTKNRTVDVSIQRES